MLPRQPEIIIGHDPGACFWLRPVYCEKIECFGWEAVKECPNQEVSIDEEDVRGFLRYFFYRHFDKQLFFNKQRKEDFSGEDNVCEPAEFDWYLTHNFYTRREMENMLDEIVKIADFIDDGMVSMLPPELRGGYRIDHFTDDEKGYTLPKEEADEYIDHHMSVASAFYRRFVTCMKKMLADTPDWPLISIMGP